MARAKTVFGSSRAAGHLQEDRAGRTKLEAEVRDARRLMERLDHGWHRVTV